MYLSKKLLKNLMQISIKYNSFPKYYLSWRKVYNKNTFKILMNILYYSEYELYDLKDIYLTVKKYLKKNILDLPIYLNNSNLNKNELLFNSIPIIIIWRLQYNIPHHIFKDISLLPSKIKL